MNSCKGSPSPFVDDGDDEWVLALPVKYPMTYGGELRRRVGLWAAWLDANRNSRGARFAMRIADELSAIDVTGVLTEMIPAADSYLDTCVRLGTVSRPVLEAFRDAFALGLDLAPKGETR